MKYKLKKYLFYGLFAFLFPIMASAQSALKRLEDAGVSGGYNVSGGPDDGTLLARSIGNIINAFLGILGIIFIILILLAGFNWMTAGGEEEKVTRAKDTLRRAIIGLIIIVSAWGIWAFISSYVIGGGTTTTPPPAG